MRPSSFVVSLAVWLVANIDNEAEILFNSSSNIFELSTAYLIFNSYVIVKKKSLIDFFIQFQKLIFLNL